MSAVADPTTRRASSGPYPSASPNTLTSPECLLCKFGSPILLFLAAALICAVRIRHQPEFDELYHILAARGWLETGRFVIADGEYNRAGLFTLLIAVLFRLFGEGVYIARLPSSLAYSILVPIFFVWMRKQTNPLAAWIASILLLTSPFIVELATFIRFYAVQVTSFTAGVIFIQMSLLPSIDKKGRLIEWAMAILFLVFATYLQIVTLIGVLGLLMWLFLEKIGPWYLAQSMSARLLCLITAMAAGTGLFFALANTEILVSLIQRFRVVPEFQQDTVNQFWFYHFWLVMYYPLLWTAFPILMVGALATFPQMARLSSIIFIVAFSISSFAGSKDTRYLAYAFPFLFAIFGMGIAAIWPSLRNWFHNTLWLAVPSPVSGAARTRWETVTATLVILFVIIANGATPRLVTMLAGIRLPPQPPLVNWAAAMPTLLPLVAKSDVVITNDELAALYYLGTYDVLMSSSRLSELPDKREFARDFRTGGVVIASASALEMVMSCFKTGLVVLDRVHLGSLRPGVAALLTREMQTLPLPREWTLDVYIWNHHTTPIAGSLCDGISHRKLPH